jgi:hypothetical protein
MKMKLLGFLLVATLPLLSFTPKAAKRKRVFGAYCQFCIQLRQPEIKSFMSIWGFFQFNPRPFL